MEITVKEYTNISNKTQSIKDYNKEVISDSTWFTSVESDATINNASLYMDSLVDIGLFSVGDIVTVQEWNPNPINTYVIT